MAAMFQMRAKPVPTEIAGLKEAQPELRAVSYFYEEDSIELIRDPAVPLEFRSLCPLQPGVPPPVRHHTPSTVDRLPPPNLTRLVQVSSPIKKGRI
ncbi:MAG: hypothetical protein Q9218_005742 [Villophora microphyllina]